jgi:two-component system, cell cycle response regulator
MQVLYLGEDVAFSKKIKAVVEKHGFLYKNVESYEKIYKSSFDLLILDENVQCLFDTEFMEKIGLNGFICSPVMVIMEEETFEIKKFCFELGIRAYFKKAEFDYNRLERYLETLKRERENFKILRAMKIAVVDDSVFSLNLIRGFFTNYNVRHVDYYKDAAKFLEQKNKHHLFLLDLVMPEYDGEEMIAHVRKNNPEAIILLITAYKNGGVISHCLSIGADDFILKPLELKLFMARINSCISHYRLNKEVEKSRKKMFELASKDALTGAYNRAYFLDAYKRKTAEMSRKNKAISFVLVDIDYFKNINDEYGHLNGDYVLKEVVMVLKNSMRETDLLCRWGGEEFVILLNNATLNEAEALAERMQLCVEQHDFPQIGEPITASFGVTEKNANDDIESVFKRLDNSLYLAKLTGRNRVISNEKLQIVYRGMSRKIEWGPFFRSGNIEVDKEHYELIVKMNELITQYFSGAPREEVVRLAVALGKNVVIHFRHEEVVLKKRHYEKYNEQRKFHRNFLHSLLRHYESLQNKDEISAEDIQYLIESIIVGHIVKNDFKFFSVLKK